jgi:cytochrome c oxidase cbb3-type subunit III
MHKFLTSLLLCTVPGLSQQPAYPQHALADAATVGRGKALYGVHCAFCHGSDARGGEGGPNLLRAQLVLDDENGERISPVVRNGRPDRGMPAIPLTAPQIVDVAAFIHSFRVAGYDISRLTPASIVVGDAKAGEIYFKKVCSGCHTVDGDLKGIGARYEDAKILQTTYLMPGAARGAITHVPPTTVTVTPASGAKLEGRLVHVDDFTVTLAGADGSLQTIRRDGNIPKVELHDPLEPHRRLLGSYSDSDMHNLTAYLVTLK